MTTTFDLADGITATLTERFTPWGTQVSGHAYDADARLIADVPEVQYMDYCRSCRHALTLERMFPAHGAEDFYPFTGDCDCGIVFIATRGSL